MLGEDRLAILNMPTALSMNTRSKARRTIARPVKPSSSGNAWPIVSPPKSSADRIGWCTAPTACTCERKTAPVYQCTSWPRAVSSRAIGSFGATWPVAGIVANRKRLMISSLQGLVWKGSHTMAVEPPGGICEITSE
jgi:hypothetical protein